MHSHLTPQNMGYPSVPKHLPVVLVITENFRDQLAPFPNFLLLVETQRALGAAD